jgi:hypothetical protein
MLSSRLGSRSQWFGLQASIAGLFDEILVSLQHLQYPLRPRFSAQMLTNESLHHGVAMPINMGKLNFRNVPIANCT